MAEAWGTAIVSVKSGKVLDFEIEHDESIAREQAAYMNCKTDEMFERSGRGRKSKTRWRVGRITLEPEPDVSSNPPGDGDVKSAD